LLTIHLKVPKRLKVLHRQFDNKRTSAASPPIAFDAAGEQLAKMVDFDKAFLARVAFHFSGSS
jgi:hypothetical protein